MELVRCISERKSMPEQITVGKSKSEEAYEQDEAFMNIYESINFKELTDGK